MLVRKAAIILAGGLAKRFQVEGGRWTDKALANIYGKPLLVHILERVTPIVEETIICVNNEMRKLRYIKMLRNYSFDHVKICIDMHYPHISGPAVAITTGLKVAKADYCIILPCDTPFIQPAVLEHLFNAVRKSIIAVPIHSDGRLETLMFTCERLATTNIAETLCLLERDRPDDIIRGSSTVNFVSTAGELKSIDPEFRSFTNINFQEDLTKLTTRVFENGPVRESIYLKLGSPKNSELEQLKEATKNYRNNKLLETFNVLDFLAKNFESKRLDFWAGICREKESRVLFSLASVESNAKVVRRYCLKGEAVLMRAAQNYASEAKFYESAGIDFLAKRAREDELWCKRSLAVLTSIDLNKSNEAFFQEKRAQKIGDRQACNKV
jgi:molybdopterin-guanine dinucleotide biosynthesis protein A